MPSLNFKKQFVPLIESGKKRQTIRPVRKNPIKAGDKLYLFTGLRTKKYRKLDTPYNVFFPKNLKNNFVICKSVEKIKIYYNNPADIEIQIMLNKKVLDFNDKITLIVNDGFIKDYGDFAYFFENNYKLPFEGTLIKW